MKNTWKNRLLAVLLAVCTVLGVSLPAQASSIQDGSKTCTVALAPIHNYLQTTAGTWLGAGGYNYTTNDGLTGPAYCIDLGLDYTGKVLPIVGKYTASPKTAGAFANGYPQHSLETFLDLYLEANPILSGLTEYEYRYATQLAVWATLGQLAVDGTAFTSGRERITYPSGDAQQLRVFCAVRCILAAAARWGKIYQTGMYIRVSDNALDGNVAISPDMTLEFAAQAGRYGIKREVINGIAYYTKEYIFASATSTYYQDYTIDLWATNCPAGTIFTDLNNVELAGSRWHDTRTWRLPVERQKTSLNYNGFEFSGKAKLCIPVDTVTPSGEITIHCAAQIMQYEIYLANNETQTEQSYIIADPSKGALEADAVLSWGGPITETGSLQVTKVGAGNIPLEGAAFSLTGTDGSSRTGTTDARGIILWERLQPDITYTLTETAPPAGYGAVEPMTLTVQASQFAYLTVRDDPQHTLTVHKTDKQTGYSLRGAVIAFEQIDGDFYIEKTTDHAGIIQMNADQLPIGSYKIYEIAMEQEGYEVDPTPHTVHWDGSRDVTLTIQDVRKPTLIISKQDGLTHYGLSGATLDLYRDGSFVTSVTTNELGLAYIPDVVSGSYYTVVERTAPEGYWKDEAVHGIYIDAYDPATTDDPRIVVENMAFPSLRIIKYDRAANSRMSGVTFEIFKDTTSLGRFQTDQDGEILLERIEPGTYKAVEVDTGDDGWILDTTPQEVELKAGGGMRELVFFNDRLPGIHLIKVDSAALSKPIANARFRFEAVDKSYGPVEYSTGADGAIDLSKLPVGAYVVTELECAGYVVDDAQRIIQLDGNETAQFIFTNSKLPSLKLTKTSADGSPLAGATYRLTRIADGSRYLDRTTSTDGTITWEGLEPGVYSLQETDTAPTHILDEQEYHVELFPGKDSTVVLTNDRRPSLTIHKTDADTGASVPDAVFTVKAVDGSTVSEARTGTDGTVTVENLLPGVYEVSEKSVPSPYLLDAPSQNITLYANRDSDIYFENHKAPTIQILKEDSITHDPIPNVRFQVWYASNHTSTGEYNDLGVYTTDANGRIDLTGPGDGLKDGWFRVKELAPASGYAIKDTDTQEAFVQAGKGHTFIFENTPLSALVVWKYDSVTREGVEGAVFQVKYLSGTSGTGGTVIGTYKTSANGSFTVTGLKAGTYIVEELASDSGHVIDTAPQTAFISGEEQDVVQLYFGNSPKGNLLVKKVDAGTGAPLSDVEFLVTTSDGTVVGDANGRFMTDSAGTFTVSGITPGTTLIVKETRARSGYLLDNTAQTAQIKAGQTVTLEFRNQAVGSALIHKVDSVTGKGIYGVTFLVSDAKGNPVGQYTSDNQGYVYINGELADGRYTIREIQAADGYIPDTTPKTFYVRYGECSTITWYNTPCQGQIQITKTSADYNSTNGWAAGTPIPGCEFEIYNKAGNLVDTIRTDKNGVAASKALPLGQYKVVESKAADYYALDTTPFYVELQYAGQIVRIAATNKSIKTGTSISKTGYKEVMPGQAERFAFSDIGNTSTVSLQNFYWRDTIPTDALRLSKVVTGSWNVESSYKIVYLTNKSGGEYRTLADNLSTRKVYTIDASPVALGLARDEYVTEVMAVFGVVPAGFHQVEAPALDFTVVSGLSNGYQFVNRADAGGTYNGAWVQAVTRWVTKVYAPTKPLPRTGY